MASSIANCMQITVNPKSTAIPSNFLGTKISPLNISTAHKNKKHRSLKVVAAVGDVSSEGTTYLIAGAAAVALLGTAFPILFSRKDTYFPILLCYFNCRFNHMVFETR